MKNYTVVFTQKEPAKYKVKAQNKREAQKKAHLLLKTRTSLSHYTTEINEAQ